MLSQQIEMATSGTIRYGEMFEHFKRLTYPDKLTYFHAHFDIIPFPFPDFDTEISWYNDSAQLLLLTENFHKEKPIKFTSEKTFTEDGNAIKFNVHPVTPTQRLQYNQFIVSIFLKKNFLFKSKTNSSLQAADNPEAFLISHINFLTSVQDWIKDSIGQPGVKTSLRNQFLQVLFHGLNFYNAGRKISIQKRRKFVELYLFSQGFFFADHLAALRLLLKQKQNACLDLSIE